MRGSFCIINNTAEQQSNLVNKDREWSHTWRQSINQSINARFVGRRYTTRRGAPAIVSCKHDQKVHS